MNKDYKVTAICYADENFSDAQKLNIWTAKHIAKADYTISYGPDDIDSDFRHLHADIFKYPKGGGYWLWKPYIIYHTLRKVKDGEYVFYLDSGCMFLKPIGPFIKFMKSNNISLLCFYTPFPEHDWDKKKLFEKYDGTFDIQDNLLQIEGGYICLQKCPETMKIISEWLDSCCIAENLLDLDLADGEQHRHDQSNFSLVCKKYGIKAYKNPSNRYLYKNFDNTLKDFYINAAEMKKYKDLYFSLEEIPGIANSIFCHSRRNASLYLLRVLKSIYLFNMR